MKGMFKVFAAGLLAAFAFGAQAADTMKGTNQNGHSASVGYDFIASAKHSGGVTSYRTTASNDVFTLTDSSGVQFANWQSWAGNSVKSSTVNGWTYNLRKADVTCQYAKSVVTTPGKPGTDDISDNCALANGN